MNVGRVVGILYESNILLKQGVKNDFAEMTAGQVWPKDMITFVAIGTDVWYDTMANEFTQISLPIGSEPRLSDERATQLFRTHRNQNEDLFFEFRR